MPKAPKWYAAAAGREGPAIYRTWDECKANTERYPGSKYKSFRSEIDAIDWLASNTQRGGTPSRSQIVRKSRPFNPAEADIIDLTASPPKQKATAPSSSAGPFSDSDVEIVDAPPTPQIEVQLSDKQKEVLQHVQNGQSVFYTGSAGTGKSVLLREIIAHFRRVYGSQKELAITASTGIASVNIGGCTLHSWAGIGIGNEDAEKYAGKFNAQPKFDPVVNRWRKVRTLIVDEISMLDGVLFDKLEHIARRVRHSDRPFGGIQLILSGDFYQLPPVPGRDKNGAPISAQFAFDASSWPSCVPHIITLTHVFRQKEQKFIDMLNAMRFGEISSEAAQEFMSLSRKVSYNDGIEPTELYSTRREVDNANFLRLNQLKGKPIMYTAHDVPGRDANGYPLNEAALERVLDRLVVPKSLTLKVGAQVMLVKNLQQGRLVNGSVGTVLEFKTPANALDDRIDIGIYESKEQETRPVKDSPAFQRAQGQKWPLVKFLNGQTVLIIPLEFEITNSEGEMEAKRDQIPLIMAWALSVHKSQGQTLERVRVDLRKTFEKGQAYVALSRATRMDQLEVLNFDPTRIMAHPRVIEWHKQFVRLNRFGVGSSGAQADASDFDDDELVDDMHEMDDDMAMQAYYQ